MEWEELFTFVGPLQEVENNLGNCWGQSTIINLQQYLGRDWSVEVMQNNSEVCFLQDIKIEDF